MDFFPIFELFPQEKPTEPILKHKVTLCFPLQWFKIRLTIAPPLI